MVFKGIFKVIKKIKTYGNMVMFSHSLFSLPFAAVAMLWSRAEQSGINQDVLGSMTISERAAALLPEPLTIFWIIAALVGARNGANALNRIIDRKIDALNPRTAVRHIPSGKVSLKEAWIITGFCFALYVFSAFMLNPLCALLSPLPLAVIFLYSYTKRFTAFCHAVLGVACGCAPAGAWMAVTGEIGLGQVLAGAMVALWVAGFDIIYAISDIEFDRQNNLHSIPALLGAEGALIVAGMLHIGAFSFMIILNFMTIPGLLSGIGIALSGVLLGAEHVITSFSIRKLQMRSTQKVSGSGAGDNPGQSGNGTGFWGLAAKIASYSLNQAIGVVYFVFNVANLFFIPHGGKL